METAQVFSTNAEQARRHKELEYRRRQRERHEQQMRKAEASNWPGDLFADPQTKTLVLCADQIDKVNSWPSEKAAFDLD